MSAAPLTAAVVVAGGTGNRFGRPGGKQLAPVAGHPVLEWTMRAIAGVEAVDLVVVVCHAEALDEVERLARRALPKGTPCRVVPGGETRRLSVAAGLAAVPPSVRTVIVHDGARPLATPELFARALAKLEQARVAGVVVGHSSVDTVKVVDGERVVSTPERSTLWAVQTPQVFDAEILRAAHAAAEREGFEGTDDASLVERAGGAVLVIEGPRDNVKITMPEDVAVAESVIASRERGEGRP